MERTKTRSEGAIPEILSDALGVSFDQAIGHDYIDNSDQKVLNSIILKKIVYRLILDYFNKITKGGLPNKTLQHIALAGTGVGKSLFMCHCACIST